MSPGKFGRSDLIVSDAAGFQVGAQPQLLLMRQDSRDAFVDVARRGGGEESDVGHAGGFGRRFTICSDFQCIRGEDGRDQRLIDRNACFAGRRRCCQKRDSIFGPQRPEKPPRRCGATAAFCRCEENRPADGISNPAGQQLGKRRLSSPQQTEYIIRNGVNFHAIRMRIAVFRELIGDLHDVHCLA